ncbi:MAG: DMT family transporter, partial [Gemmatimonadota bacterium]|nr:DMT family transporter [Gemmatimonadota bacterium]
MGVFCIAWSALFVRWAGVSGPASAFYRVLVATLVLVPVRLWRGEKSPPHRGAILLGCLAGVFFALDVALFNSAVLRTSAANSTLLGNNAPVLVGLGSWLVFRKRPRRVYWLGLLLALTGSGTIAVGDALRHVGQLHAGASGGLSGGFGTGDAMAVAASVFFAAYLLTIERVRSSMDTLTLTTIAVTASTVTLFLLCLLLGSSLTGY